MSRPGSACRRFRGHHVVRVVFALLVLVVAGERRLADAHLNRQSSLPVLENNDALDGDEIRIRLVLLGATAPPTLAPIQRAAEDQPWGAGVEKTSPAPFDGHSPRAPPV